MSLFTFSCDQFDCPRAALPPGGYCFVCLRLLVLLVSQLLYIVGAGQGGCLEVRSGDSLKVRSRGTKGRVRWVGLEVLLGVGFKGQVRGGSRGYVRGRA